MYIVDALFNEESIFTQMDITTDGFGFMLSVGDLTWVPFVYSLQARFLAFMPNELGYLATAAILFLNLTGYYIFRTANSEKDEFRKGGNPKSEYAISLDLCESQQLTSFFARPQVYDYIVWSQAHHFGLVGPFPPS